MQNNFKPVGAWEICEDGYYIWTGPAGMGDTITLFGQCFHCLAIQTKGETEQVALHPGNQRELDALHTAGGTSAGYCEIEIDGEPAVVFLVPYDR